MQNCVGSFQDFLRIVPDQDVGPLRAGDRPFGIGADRYAGDAEDGRFFLQAAAVGQDQPGVHVQVEKFEIAERLGTPDPLDFVAGIEVMRKAELFRHLPRARVNREDDRQFPGDGRQGLQQAGEDLRVVDVAGAMQSHGGITAGLQAHLGAEIEACSHLAVLHQGVDHDVADEEDLLRRHAFGFQVLVGEVVGGEQVVAEDVGAEAVDFLRHAHIPRTQTGLDVRHLDAELLGGDGAGHGRVDVADNDHQIGLLFQADLLEGDHDLCRLLGVRAAADFQVDVGLGHAEIVEEGFAHLLVVVLAGVDEEVLDLLGVFVHGLDDRGHFHEVGAGTDDVDDFQNNLFLSADYADFLDFRLKANLLNSRELEPKFNNRPTSRPVAFR